MLQNSTTHGNHKDESIMNLLKVQNKQQQEAFTEQENHHQII